MTSDRTARWLSSTFVLALSVGILLAPSAVGSTSRPVAASAATDSPPIQWAFAGTQLVNQSTTQGAVTVTESGQYNWADLLSEASSGPFSARLTVEQGLWGTFAYRLCTPSCAAPTYTLSASMVGRGWTSEVLNLSLRASTSGGVAAIGAVDARVTSASTYNASTTVVSAGAPPATENLVASATSAFTLGFAPAFALFPIGALSGPSWGAASTVTTTGGWTSVRTTSYTGLATPNSRVAAFGNLSTPLSLTGSATDGGSPVVLLGGESTVPQAVAVSGGGLALRDGLLWTPGGANLFVAPAGGAATPVPGAMALAGPTVDFDAGNANHLGIAAAQEAFQPIVAAPASAPAPPTGVAVANFEPPSWTVQAQPEAAATAMDAFSSWGVGPDTSVVPVAPSHAPGGGLGVLPSVAIVAAAGLVGLVVAAGARYLGPSLAPPRDWAGVSPRGGTRRGSTPGTLAAAPPGERAAPADPPRVRDPFDDLL